MEGRPLDVLEAALGDEVAVRLKGGETYRGRLEGFDQHMNVVLSPPDDVADAGDGDGSPVEDTTVIRGDNVVTIKP